MKTYTKLSKEQAKQEAEYVFPYHYIVTRGEDSFSQTLNLSWGFEYISYISFVLDKLSRLQFKSLLDIGCGDGRFLFEARKKLPHAELAGLDFSERAVSFARILSPEANYIVGDITDKKALDKKFDVITAIEVLEHIHPAQLPDFLESLHFFLKSGGSLIITVPSRNVRVRSKHYQHFDVGLLAEVLNPLFEISEKYFLNRIGRRTKTIKKILSNNIFLLQSKVMLNAIYNYYEKNLLNAEEKNSQRIFVICRKMSANINQ
jgi:2-polyprenyl-3-methyl-5-hydroxy-6-metoxy-1,4-benzoquinol methylase